MKRWAFNVAAGVSLVMCLATAALWVRSYWVYDAYNWESGGGNRPFRFSMLVSIDGVLFFERQIRDRSTTWPPRRGFFEYWNGIKEVSSPASRPTTATTLIEWGTDTLGFARSDRTFRAIIPHVGIMAILAIVPMLWLKGALRESRQRKKGRCLFCGYDLRATPDRCPECGSAAEKGQVAEK